jgi:hypothetical protein
MGLLPFVLFLLIEEIFKSHFLINGLNLIPMMMIIEMSLTEPSIESHYGCYYYDYGHHSFCIFIKWNGTMFFFL